MADDSPFLPRDTIRPVVQQYRRACQNFLAEVDEAIDQFTKGLQGDLELKEGHTRMRN